MLTDDPYSYRLGPSERAAFRYINQALIHEGLLKTLLDPDEIFATAG